MTPLASGGLRVMGGGRASPNRIVFESEAARRRAPGRKRPCRREREARPLLYEIRVSWLWRWLLADAEEDVIPAYWLKPVEYSGVGAVVETIGVGGNISPGAVGQIGAELGHQCVKCRCATRD